MSFCLNCGNHKTCQCAGPPPEVSFGPTVESLEAREHLPKHPATRWFDQQVEEGLLSNFNAGGVEDIRHLMTKAFNAGCSYACREILDVLPQGPPSDICLEDIRYSVNDVDAICHEWLG